MTPKKKCIFSLGQQKLCYELKVARFFCLLHFSKIRKFWRFKNQLTFAFLAAVNHLSRPLWKQNFFFNGFKSEHLKWNLIRLWIFYFNISTSFRCLSLGIYFSFGISFFFFFSYTSIYTSQHHLNFMLTLWLNYIIVRTTVQPNTSVKLFFVFPVFICSWRSSGKRPFKPHISSGHLCMRTILVSGQL